MDTTRTAVSITEMILFLIEILAFIIFLPYTHFAIAADKISAETGFGWKYAQPSL